MNDFPSSGAAIVLDAETRTLEAPAHGDALRLWLRLLTCANLIEAEIRRRLRENFDVTLPRFDLLAQLERAPDGMTLGELSKRMMVSNGNITGLVETLVDLGLVARVPHPADRRAAVVRLTAAGKHSFADMARAHADWVSGMLSGLAPGEMTETMRLLADVKRSVRRYAAEGRDEKHD